MSIRYTLRKVKEEDLLNEETPNYNNLKRNELCITDTGKVYIRLSDDQLVEFTGAAAQYAANILGEVISLKEQIYTVISEVTSISDETVEQILNATSQAAAIKRDLDEQETRMTGIADRCQDQVGSLIDQVNSLIAQVDAATNIESMTDSEIDSIVGGGNE